MTIYTITLKNQIQHSSNILFFFLLFSAMPFYMIYKYGIEDLTLYILLSILIFSWFFIPLLIIHLNYYKINKGDFLIYDISNRAITINRNGVDHRITFDDIESMVVYKSNPLAENRVLWLPWDFYHHSVIKLKSGKSFVITSLMVPNLEIPIDATKIKIIKSIYRLA